MFFSYYIVRMIFSCQKARDGKLKSKCVHELDTQRGEKQGVGLRYIKVRNIYKTECGDI
jgi:hypothetical protein